MFTPIQYLLPSLILIAGLIDDIRSQKIHNWLSVSCLILAIVVVGLTTGLDGLKNGLWGMLIALAMTLPLVLARVLGAGDMKLLMAFGMATDLYSVFWVVMYSLIWGAMLGVFRVLLQKDILSLLKNLATIVTSKNSQKTELHSIPYTVAFLFGWLIHLTLIGVLNGSPL